MFIAMAGAMPSQTAVLCLSSCYKIKIPVGCSPEHCRIESTVSTALRAKDALVICRLPGCLVLLEVFLPQMSLVCTATQPRES